MKLYIASRYIAHKSLNRKIHDELVKVGVDVFLPASINIDAIRADEMLEVAETCYNEIEQCDILLVVCPHGKSVACEFGYAVALKRVLLKRIRIVVYNSDINTEAMISPYIDKTVDNITELIEYLNT